MGYSCFFLALCFFFFARARVHWFARWTRTRNREINHCALIYYPGQKKEPSSRFAARRTLFHVWYHARSRAISAGQKSRTVADRTLPCADRLWSSMISHVEQRSSRRESRRWLFFLARVVHYLHAHCHDQQPAAEQCRSACTMYDPLPERLQVRKPSPCSSCPAWPCRRGPLRGLTSIL